MSDEHGRDNDLQLSTVDFFGDPDDLRRQLDEAGDHPGPPQRAEGSDETDSIRVSVDRDGRVDSVDISRHWRDRMDPGHFPTALFDAYADAVRKMITSVAVTALAAAEEDGGHPLDPTPAIAASPTAPATATPDPPVDEREWLAATRSLLADIDDQLRRLDRISTEIAVRDTRETTRSSPHGYLTAQVEGQAISNITGNVQRIRAASDEQLRLEAFALLRAAAGTTEH